MSVVENLYDAIVTDPPYGIRAGAKKTGGCITILLHSIMTVVWLKYQ
jgi:tRNA G10  N-methylase Trm11